MWFSFIIGVIISIITLYKIEVKYKIKIKYLFWLTLGTTLAVSGITQLIDKCIHDRYEETIHLSQASEVDNINVYKTENIWNF